MNKAEIPVCCVICVNKNGEVLFVKRGKEPHQGKWSLISGVGYAKKQLTPEQGVHDEVMWDVMAKPTDVELLFTFDDGDAEIMVFTAKVEPQEVAPRQPDVSDIQWCSLEDVSKLGELGFEHSDIIKKFSEYQSYQ